MSNPCTSSCKQARDLYDGDRIAYSDYHAALCPLHRGLEAAPIMAGDRIFLSEGLAEIVEILSVYRDGTISAQVQFGDGERVCRSFEVRDVIPRSSEEETS